MSNVTSFPGATPPPTREPNQALISALEDTLKHAKSGFLQSLIATGHTSTDERFTLWFDTNPDVYQTLGSLAWLQHEYVHRKANGIPPGHFP